MKKLLLFFVALLFSAFALAAVDINKASKDDLDKLPGIGPVKAQAIIDYRTKNGPFKSIEDLKNVNGIGDATFDKLKSEITVSGGGGAKGSDKGSAKAGDGSVKPADKAVAKAADKMTEKAGKDWNKGDVKGDTPKKAAEKMTEKAGKDQIKGDVKGDIPKKVAEKMTDKGATKSVEKAAEKAADAVKK